MPRSTPIALAATPVGTSSLATIETITYESDASSRCATLATFSYECHDWRIASGRSTGSDHAKPPVRGAGGAQPYVLPDRVLPEPDRVGYVRDWMRLRPGESEAERAARLYHTCYVCGAFIVDMAALASHEDECHP